MACLSRSLLCLRCSALPCGRAPPGIGGRVHRLQIPAEARADALVAAAERTAEAERATLADLLAVADRHRRLAALPADAGADAALRAAAVRGVDRHVHHRGVHRALAIDALVLVVQAVVHAVAEIGELVAERLDALV